jgi:cysteinyl-tRNA synthetase
VKYWVHNEFLQVDGGKMSKSLWNAYILADIEVNGFSPLDLRYFYFMAQYSNPQNFTWEALTQAKKTRENLKKKVKKCWRAYSEQAGTFLATIQKELPTTLPELADKVPTAEKLVDQIDEAMKDNLNTPKLLSVLSNALNAPSEGELAVLYWLEKRILKVGLFDGIASSLSAVDAGHCPKGDDEETIPAEILELANQRVQAKQEKNYEVADVLRAKIQELGYMVTDIP